jgi:hypothetical protein
VSLTDEKVQFLLGEVAELKKYKNKYGELHLKLKEEKAFLIGKLYFTATLNGETISDSYKVKIEFPQSYPDIPPSAEEIGGRIRKTLDDHVSDSRFLCLAPALEILSEFKKEPTLLNYLENQLIPILCWHSYKEKHPEESLPAYSHCGKGIEEYRAETNLKEKYLIILESDDINVVLLLLKLLIDGTCKNNPKCPCKRGLHLKDCHGKFLQTLLDMPYLKPEHIKCDYDKMFQEAKEHGEIADIRPFLPKRNRKKMAKRKLNKKS